jgi:23S rRNA (adenine2503-C2)-methyltransferase
MTPINPTYTARTNRLTSYLDPGAGDRRYQLIEDLRGRGYEVLLSIGEVEENLIGSNCGQYVTKYLEAKEFIGDGYRSRAYARD